MEQIVVGRIMSAYGIKGWVRIYSYTDPIEQILEYSPWYLHKGTRQDTIKIETGKRQGKGLVALPEGFDDRNQAETLIGWEIKVDKAQLPELDPDEYYWHQLEGLGVVNTEGENLGMVYEMLETGANDVFVVRPTEASIDDQERLIPFVDDEVVVNIDLDERRMLVNWDSTF